MKLNKEQTTAYELIQSDARFLYTLTDIHRRSRHIRSNYIMMCQPYIGIFTDGAKQWCHKMKTPSFNGKESEYYGTLRQGHKHFEKPNNEYASLLMAKLNESDKYFNGIRDINEVIEYDNVGTDLCNGKCCGYTVLCAAYSPMPLLDNQNTGNMIQELSVIAGRLAAFFDGKALSPYHFDDKKFTVECKGYHFFTRCPIKEKTSWDLYCF